MTPLILLAPLFLGFEFWQLILCERYLGLKQIARGSDPHELGLSEGTAFLWSLLVLIYWAWMALLVFQQLGQVQLASLLAITFIGFSIRRNCPHKWVLVVLTFEGALRIGMLLSLCEVIWQRFL